jgi:undecaprenyl-diphosphatase
VLRSAPNWIRTLFHIATAYGGVGIFVIAFLDSTILSFPFITDLLVVASSTRKPEWMPYYALSATIGSTLGCLSLYFTAKKGGDAFFKRHASKFGTRVRIWVKDHAFWSMFIPALLPPPFPFEVFTIAEGVFGAPLSRFLLGVLLGRGARFFLEGLLGLRYGRRINRFFLQHQAGMIIFFIAASILFVGGYLIYQRTGPSKPHDQAA